MKSLKFAVPAIVGFLLSMQQAYAGAPPLPCEINCPNGTAVPEIDGSGAIIAIGLVAGLVALFREKYFRR